MSPARPPSLPGPIEYYTGTISKLGLDVGVTTGGVMVWVVFAPTSRPVGALQGSFADFVERCTVVTPTGEVRTISADTDPDLFWATAGGMGLTGVILEATMRLRATTRHGALMRARRGRRLRRTGGCCGSGALHSLQTI